MKTIAFIPVWLSLAASALAMPPPTLSYFDSFGQYSFGYSDQMAARSEYKLADGITRGSYSFVDKNGMIQTTEYEAGKDLGFRVRASNLPQAPMPVQETPEVMKAREKHLHLLEEAQKREKQEGMLLQTVERNQGPNEGVEQRVLGEEEKKETVLGNIPSIVPATAPALILPVSAVISQAGAPGSLLTSPIHSELPHGGAPGSAASEEQAGASSGAQSGISGLAPMEVPEKAPVEAPQNDLPIVEDRSSAQFLRSSPALKAPDASSVSGIVQPGGHNSLAASEAAFRSSAQPMAPSLPLTPGAPLGIQGSPAALDISSSLSTESMTPEIRSQPAVAPAMPSALPRLMLPQPVKDTPEVMAAKEAHFRAYEAAARLAAESDLNPQVLEQVLRRTQPVAGLQLPSIPNHLNGKAAIESGLHNQQQLHGEAELKSAPMSDQLSSKGVLSAKAALESAPIHDQLNGNSVVNAKTLLPGSIHIEDPRLMLGAIEKAAAAAAQINAVIASQRLALMGTPQASSAVTQENVAQRTGMETAPQASPSVVQHQRIGGDVTTAQTSSMAEKEASHVASESRAINTIVENSQVHGVTKSTEPSNLGSDETTLTCDTALKVTDIEPAQALFNKRLIITKTGEYYYVPSLNTHVPKNWGIQYIYI